MIKRLCFILIAAIVLCTLSSDHAIAGYFGIKLKDGSTVAVTTLYDCQPKPVQGGGMQCTDASSSYETDKGQRATTLSSIPIPLQQFLAPRGLTEQQFKAEMKDWMDIFAEYQARMANQMASRPSSNTKVLHAIAYKLPQANVPNGFDACSHVEIDIAAEIETAGKLRVDRSGAFCLKYFPSRKEIIQVQFYQSTLRLSKKSETPFLDRAPELKSEANRTFETFRNY